MNRPSKPAHIALFSLSLGLTAAIAFGLGALLSNGRETLTETLEYMAAHAIWVSLLAALFLSIAAMVARRRPD